jgi:hypothetical protein
MRPGAIEASLTKIVINDAIRRKLVREQAPGDAAPDDVEDAVENLPFGLRFGPSTGFGRWDERFKDAPLSIAEVGRIRFCRFHASHRTAN